MAEDAKTENEVKAGKALIQRMKITSDFFKKTNFPKAIEGIILQYGGIDRDEIDRIIAHLDIKITFWKKEGNCSKFLICRLFPFLCIAGVCYGVPIAKYGIENPDVRGAVIGTALFPAIGFCVLIGSIGRLIESRVKIYELNALKVEVNKAFLLYEEISPYEVIPRDQSLQLKVDGENEQEDAETLESKDIPYEEILPRESKFAINRSG